MPCPPPQPTSHRVFDPPPPQPAFAVESSGEEDETPDMSDDDISISSVDNTVLKKRSLEVNQEKSPVPLQTEQLPGKKRLGKSKVAVRIAENGQPLFIPQNMYIYGQDQLKPKKPGD
jgi:hypothetical protein